MKNGVLCAVVETQMSIQLLFCIKVNNQMFKLEKCFADFNFHGSQHTGPRSAVRNVSGYRCVSDCNSRGRQFDPGPVPYFGGD